MSLTVTKRRFELLDLMRSGVSSPRGSMRGKFFTTAEIYDRAVHLYDGFAYGGKDRLHDDLVSLNKAGLVARASGKPARWRS